jgi:ribosome-associated protein
MDIRKLQRAIVDGLEDVKGQDILVLNTEHLSPLFERVIIASGTSNRQTKALASGVREAVKAAGFPVLATEGGDNGEWIIVDCGAAVVHVMQPSIREYYHLEEIWGGKPIRLKFGAAKPAQAEEAPAPAKPGKAKKSAEADGPSLRRASAAKTAIRAAEQAAKAEKAEKTPSRRSASARPAGKFSGKAPAKAPAKTAAKPTAKLVVGKPPARKAAAKPAVKAAAAPARKPAARKA